MKKVPIQLDKKNARLHPDANKEAIKKSLKDLGAGRSILIDSNNILIAGNGVYEQAQKLNLKVKIIETDGRELIAVKRTDLKTDDDKRKALAIADNRLTDLSEFNTKALDKLLSELSSELKDSAGFLAENGGDVEGEKPDVEFTQEVMEQNNYIVFTFDNILDWQVMTDLFKLKAVQALDSKPGYEKQGIGRVLSGKDLLTMLKHKGKK
jgi:hypothetical protein